MSIYFPQAAVKLRVTWENFGSDSKVLNEITIMDVSCRNVVVERNDYTEADTFKAVIDYKSFPFDPRCIRACGITVFMEDRKRVFKKSNSLDLIEPSRDNTVFQGFADESSIEFNDDTRSVTLEGRDFTSLFIDTKRINTSPVSLAQPVDVIIQELINEQEATKGISIVNRTGDVLPNLAIFAPDLNPFTAVKNQSRKETYWSIIQNILERIGLIGFIELDKFIISKPQNIYENKQIKQFIYGGNIKDLSFTRKLGRAKDYNVKLLSSNLGAKGVLEAKIPLEATSERFIQQFGNTEIEVPQLDKDGKKIDPPKVADYITFPVKDITSKEVLIAMGESVFEELSRQQIEGSFSTYEMEIPEESNDGTKPIKFSAIRNGTAIRIYLTQSELKEVNSDSSKTEKINFLVKRGYPIKVATAFSESLNKINTEFYTKSVKFELDQENGFSMNIDFVNFINIDSGLFNS